MKVAAFIITTAPAALAALCGESSGATSGKFNFNNNAYNEADGTGSQCLTVGETSNFGCSWNAKWTWNDVTAADGAPIGYPYSGITVKPKLISDIKSMETSAQWDYSTNDIVADVSYDLFTASTSDHPATYGEYELMIWLAHYGGKTPLGNKIAETKFHRINWEVYYGTQEIDGAEQQTFSFLADKHHKTFSGDVTRFFDYLTANNGFPATSQYLLTYQFGTEAFEGGPATFKVSNWDAALN